MGELQELSTFSPSRPGKEIMTFPLGYRVDTDICLVISATTISVVSEHLIVFNVFILITPVR